MAKYVECDKCQKTFPIDNNFTACVTIPTTPEAFEIWEFKKYDLCKICLNNFHDVWMREK